MSNKPIKTFKSAFKYGFRGMQASFAWLLFSFIGGPFFTEGSILKEIIYKINQPLSIAAHTLMKLGSIPADFIPIGIFIVLVLYLTTGFLLGFIFFFVCQIFRKSNTDSDLSSGGKNNWRS